MCLYFVFVRHISHYLCMFLWILGNVLYFGEGEIGPWLLLWHKFFSACNRPLPIFYCYGNKGGHNGEVVVSEVTVKQGSTVVSLCTT